MRLDPGDDHPNGPCPAADLAGRLGIQPADLLRLIDRGAPVMADGRMDPYAVVSWISWHGLDACPALGRKWRAWLRWFTTTGRTMRISVHRAQTVYLPEARPLRWLVAEPTDGPGQRILGRIWAEGEAVSEGRLITRPADRIHRCLAEDDLELAPCMSEPSDRPWAERLVADLAGGFAYQYRRHRPGATTTDAGTCLDLALVAGTRLAEQGRSWRLVCGVVAHRVLANPHFWVEYEDADGWVPLDPTIPAVARMLGADWRATVPLAVGRHDGRRIRLGTAPGGGDHAALSRCLGAIDAGGDDALYCSDWAVGECSWSIASVFT